MPTSIKIEFKINDPVIVDAGPTILFLILIIASPGGILLSINISVISNNLLFKLDKGAFLEYFTDVKEMVLIFFSLAIMAASTGA